MDGLEALNRLREWTNLPGLVLSARRDLADKVNPLDPGADDYLTKPFDAPELLARTRALLRCAAPPEEAPVWIWWRTDRGPGQPFRWGGGKCSGARAD